MADPLAVEPSDAAAALVALVRALHEFAIATGVDEVTAIRSPHRTIVHLVDGPACQVVCRLATEARRDIALHAGAEPFDAFDVEVDTFPVRVCGHRSGT